jgi:acyl-coenzyme A synthetase/AMP-(fatty) acid ligase
MPRGDWGSLWSALSTTEGLAQRAIWGADGGIALGDLAHGSSLGGQLETLSERCVLLVAGSQLAAALALIELDGVARRIVLCTPDLAAEHLPYVVATAGADAVVSDAARPAPSLSRPGPIVTCCLDLAPGTVDRRARLQTEWILLTSGTTGPPKMVVHTLASLAGAMKARGTPAGPALWSTFYDIRRYGGLQILLRATLGGGSLVLSSAGEAMSDFLQRAASRGVTHILGTPTHWRSALMSPAARLLRPQYVRLSGEIADQAILDHLRASFPDAKVVHAFASTEAGVGFEVADGKAGFPASLIGQAGAAVDMKVVDGSLRIRSSRTAARYLGEQSTVLVDSEGYVDTGDMVELRGERYYFVGRRGGIINVGGLKIHPEEVETVINTHPRVRVSLVRARKSPITGALVIADVVLNMPLEEATGIAQALEREILEHCRASLPRHKVPAKVNFVAALATAASGKIARRDA